jgi:aryl-alcohol dehydrogenase-like predicted oxidoreductase
MNPVPKKSRTQGRTEANLGSWLKEPSRARIIVATKLTAQGRGFGQVRGDPGRIGGKSIHPALDGSRRRFQSDYVDLYEIHWLDRHLPEFGNAFYNPDQERAAAPFKDQMKAFSGCVEAGKIRYFGLSNESPWGILEFTRIARDKGLVMVASVQNASEPAQPTFTPSLCASRIRRFDRLTPLVADASLAS